MTTTKPNGRKTRVSQPKKEIVRSDTFGNSLIASKRGDITTVYLKLKNNPKRRLIGKINKKKKTLYVHRTRSKHLHILTNTYGFNHHLLSTGTLFEQVKLIDETGEYKMPVSEILENGQFLHFKQEGFELQIFYPISRLRKQEKQENKI